MISIVIPLYNKAKSIANTINSILSQTFQGFEIIVVDDGSTDNSVEVVKAISDNRIRLIQKENGGVCSARNRGIIESKYDYVAFLDADDTWDENYLLEQSKLIQEFPLAYMWGINFAELYNGELIHELPTGLPKGYRGYVENYFEMPSKKGRISDLYCSSSVVIKKEAFNISGMFDERIKYSEDIDMWFRIIVKFPVVFYDKYMAFYHYDAENRAMNKERPLKYFLPYYCDKYKQYKGTYFYQWIQRWSAVNIRKYYFNVPEQRKEALEAIKKLDYSVLPKKYKFLFKSPYHIGKILYILDTLKMSIKRLIKK